MASTDFDTLSGKIESTGRPASLCYGTPWEFVQALTRILKVSFPVNRNNKFVVLGHSTPSTDDKDKMWARFNSARVPQGWFAFVKGTWRRFYTTAPGEIRWFIGDSISAPDGWQVINEDVSGVPADLLAKLMLQYIPKVGFPGRFSYYAARYIGY